jgi:hypothetical protein
MFAIFDKAKPDTEDKSDVNLAVVTFISVEVSKLPW